MAQDPNDPMRRRFKNIKVPGQPTAGREEYKGQTIENTTVQSVNQKVEDEHRLTVYMPRPLFKRFKMHCVDIEQDMSKVVVDLVNQYLSIQPKEPE